MKTIVAICLVIISININSKIIESNGYQFDIPEDFVSFEEVNSKLHLDMKNNIESGDDGMIMIANFITMDDSASKPEMSVMISEEKMTRVSDVKYLNNIAGMFKRVKFGDYVSYEWKGFERLDILEAKISYFVKTTNERQLVVIGVYSREDSKSIIEKIVLSISTK